MSAKGKRPLAFRAKKKGLDALELFASESEGSTNTDVARRLGRTVSEVFRMQVCLETRGYIARVRIPQLPRRSSRGQRECQAGATP